MTSETITSSGIKRPLNRNLNVTCHADEYITRAAMPTIRGYGVYRSRGHMPQALRKFIDFLVDHFQAIDM